MSRRDISDTDYPQGERELGKLTKFVVVVWMFSLFLGIVFLTGDSVGTFYIAIFMFTVNVSVTVIAIMWHIACKMDDIVGKYSN